MSRLKQVGPMQSKPMQGGTYLKAQRVRNPLAGKNNQAARSKDVTTIKKNSFKLSTAISSKPVEKFEEDLAKEVKKQMLKSKREEEKFMLERMKQIQIQQSDTMQACEGWSNILNATKVNFDMEAVKFVQDMRMLENENDGRPEPSGMEVDEDSAIQNPELIKRSADIEVPNNINLVQ